MLRPEAGWRSGPVRLLLTGACLALVALSVTVSGDAEAAPKRHARRRHHRHRATHMAVPAADAVPFEDTAGPPASAAEPELIGAATGAPVLQPAAARESKAAASPESVDASKKDDESPPLSGGTPPPQPAPPPAPAADGKPTLTFYGFVELDAIHDSTQGFQEPAGNAVVPRGGTFAGDHGRTMFAMRNSRLGIKLASPVYGGVKISATLEMDFLGNQPANPPGISEAAFFSNPTFRARHYVVKVETPYVDLMAGQTWQLFGWQAYFHPSTVEIQGLPGEVFSRTPQLRLSHVLRSKEVNLEIAVAAARPPQRDAQTPDAQGGVRLLFNGRRALRTVGASGTGVDPMGFGVSGTFRRFVLPELADAPVRTVSKLGWGISLDALVPIITGTLQDRANALTLTGSYVIGTGTSDLYTGLTGGIPAPAYPLPAMGAAIVAPIDAGLVAFDATGALETIDWTSYIAGLQYFLPPSGKVWLSANYSHMQSRNIGRLAAPASVFDRSDWADGNLFWDPLPGLRFGLEYAVFRQRRADGPTFQNNRVQFSALYIF